MKYKSIKLERAWIDWKGRETERCMYEMNVGCTICIIAENHSATFKREKTEKKSRTRTRFGYFGWWYFHFYYNFFSSVFLCIFCWNRFMFCCICWSSAFFRCISAHDVCNLFLSHWISFFVFSLPSFTTSMCFVCNFTLTYV